MRFCILNKIKSISSRTFLKSAKLDIRLPDWVVDFLFNRRYYNRRSYYLNVYLKSEDWKRKRHLVLKRDNWRCLKCGALATQVHHLKYAKRNIGKEPIEWLISVCKSCHYSFHK